MEITAIQIQGFKRIQNVEVLTPDLSVIVGGNNSGKSSLLQGIHFAITTLQSTITSNEKSKSLSTLGFDQFIYKPASDLITLNHGSPITSKSGPEFNFTYRDAGSDDTKSFNLSLRRGKNANISVTFDTKDPFFLRASDRTRPISIFVPGLAGVALREEKRTDSIVNTGIAQGDSNLYLRNVLLRLIQNPKKMDRFHEIIGYIFPGLTISTAYNEKLNPFIDITVDINEAKIPLELVGTGCLQAIQLVAYVTMYEPSLLLLDEPDAHLHPSNQRALASTLQRITESSDTKVLLASHSRHIFDSLTHNSSSQVVWLQNGAKQPQEDADNLSILLDLGALDSYELVQSGTKRIVVLTEDTKTPRLLRLLEANGIPIELTLIQPFHGVENIDATVPVADFFSKQGNNTHVIIHRDGDCMTTTEKEWLSKKIAQKLPERSHVFITELNDIEHYFCSAQHLKNVYGNSIEHWNEFIDKIIENRISKFTVEFSNKRNNLKEKTLRGMDKIPSAADMIEDKVKFGQIKGKSLFPEIIIALTESGLNSQKFQETITDGIVSKRLMEIAKSITDV